MPDMKIFCEQCGTDRFDVSMKTPEAETVHSILCATCGQGIKVDEVVIFRDVMFLSGSSEPELRQPCESPPL